MRFLIEIQFILKAIKSIFKGFVIEILFILKAKKIHFKGYMINRILHSWSFLMKIMKLAEGSFHKYHMK